MRSRTRSETAIAAGAADVLCVLAFVVAGRRSHDEGNGLGGVLEVAAPFLIALVLGWLAARAWRRPVEVRTGAVVWLATIAVGMLLRRVVFDRGTAVSFVIVATLVLGTLIVGWRALVRAVSTRRERHAVGGRGERTVHESAG